MEWQVSWSEGRVGGALVQEAAPSPTRFWGEDNQEGEESLVPEQSP